jgi:uncharacterized protein
LGVTFYQNVDSFTIEKNRFFMKSRYLKKLICEDALKSNKMAFLSGPRQVGKTTLAKLLLGNSKENYFNWDDQDFKKQWVKSPKSAIGERGSGLIVLDEIHKDRKWKSRLKGIYDVLGNELPILVTGSARLDLYRKGGDSLMGRYLPYRMHPLSVAESATSIEPDAAFKSHSINIPWKDLLHLSGFPEPHFGSSEQKAKRWSRLRLDRLIYEDVRDLHAIHDVQALRVLCELLPERVGSLLSINSLREDMGAAYGTVYNWLRTLEALYDHFLIRPYANKVKRAIRAEPKMYLYDILRLDSKSKRLENLLALHLLKACDYWTDAAMGFFEVRFIRNKEKEEVDFCVLRNEKVWLLVECKSNEKNPSVVLTKFTELLKPAFSFQLVDVEGYDKYFPSSKIRVCSYDRFCSGLI